MKILAKLAKQMTATFVRKNSTRRVRQNPQNQTPPDGSTPASSIKTASTENMSTLATSPTFTVSSTSESATMKPSDKDNTSQSSTSSDFHDDDSTAHLSEQFDMDDEEVQCPCSEHTGRLIMNQVVQVSVEKLYELLFTESDFMSEYNTKNRVGSYVAATWVRNHQGENTRSCTYTIFVANPLASKDIVVNEKQVLIHFTNPKHGFIMQKETQNSGVPYADHFTVNCQYCVSRTGPTSCRVKVHAAIVYKKSIWGVVKGFVEKGTFSALDEHYKILSKMFEEYTLKNPEPEKS